MNLSKVIIKAFLIVSLFSPIAIAETPEEAFIYITPVPNSELNLKETTIILRTGDIFDQVDSSALSHVIITGDHSGGHSTEVIFSDDFYTIIIKPDEYFVYGESVSVEFDSLEVNDIIVDGDFSFAISLVSGQPTAQMFEKSDSNADDGSSMFKHDKEIDESLILDNDVSLPSDFPARALLANDNPDSGFIFVSNIGRDAGTPYIMILDNDAHPVFYRRMPIQTWDFKVQPTGYLTYIMENTPFFMVMDSTYTVIDSFSTMNGYYTEEHDFQMLDNGHVLIASYDYQLVDMSEVVPEGNPNAIVVGYVIQELDSNRNVIFQWRTWDHVEITEATNMGFGGSYIDYVHGNTLELDSDGNLLTSFRNMESLTKINRQTGEVIWRLGGVSNQFTIINDPIGWSRQHDIRRLPNGNISIYDNARLNSPPYNVSHASEYALDEVGMTCTLVWEYVNTPGVYGPFMGNAQRLSNGNTLIGWGGRAPITITEARPDSTKAWEMTFSLYDDHRVFSYRAFRFPWHGVAARPYLIAEPSDTLVHLIFNKFGDTSVAKYYIYAGLDAESLAVIDSTANTFIDITGLPSGLTYFRVTAVDSSGSESPFSNEVRVNIEFYGKYLPGDANMYVGLWPPSVLASDVTYLVNYFRMLPWSPPCEIAGFFCAADINGDCQIIGSDVTALISYFRGIATMSWCEAYPPLWQSPDDLPEEAPSNWPNCEPVE